MKIKEIYQRFKKSLKWCGTIAMTALTFRKPVSRDRWLFGTNGSGMVMFALWIAILVPSIIWGFTKIYNHIADNDIKVNELLLTNYDTDISKLKGHAVGDTIVLEAEEKKPQHEDYWAILSQYTDPGNLPSAQKENGGYWLAIICALAGIFCLSGLAVSSLISFINRTTERWKQGLLRYDILFGKYVVIIGCNKQTANLAKLALQREDVKYVLIMTRQNVEEMRMKLDLDLDHDEEKRIVFYYAERTSREDIEQLHLEKAKDIFILGEDVNYDNEEDHDVFNISCLENISAYFKNLPKNRKPREKMRVHVNLEYQSTFTAFKYTHIYRSLDKVVEFLPYNIHEIWAKKLLVDNFAIVPIGKKGEMKVQNYLPIDSPNGIKANDNKTVHMIIVGMNQMGTALGVQTALLCHFPNAHRDRNLRTKITFIDDQAVKEGEFFRGRFSTLFDLCRYRVIDIIKDPINDGTFDKEWIDPLLEGRYKHLCEDDNFMDIEWEFIQGNVASDEVRSYLSNVAQNEKTITNIAICFNHPQNSIAAALYLPEMVYRRSQQIFVYQQNSFDLANKVTNGEKVWKRYEKLRPFGMIEGSYTENAFDNSMAKILHFLYTNNLIRRYGSISENPYAVFEVENISKLKGVSLNMEFARQINESWSQQGIVDKLSNIDMVDSIPMKLRSLGITMDNLELFHEAVSEDKALEYLAKAEHTRWLTERTTMGYRPLDDNPSEWGFFTNPDLDSSSRKKAKAYRKDKSRAHLDICSNTMLMQLDPGTHYNDMAVVLYIPQILKYKEWLNMMKLGESRTRDSIAGKLLKDFVVAKRNCKNYFAPQVIENGSDVYWMLDTAVSQDQWVTIMGVNPTPKAFRDKKNPVVNVSKLDVEDFLKVLRKRTGLYFDLPTFTEWQQAAIMSIGNAEFDVIKKYLRVTRSIKDEHGPDKVLSHSRLVRGGLKLYNILGNVWEWTKTEPENETGCFCFCGGSWRFRSKQCDLSDDYWYSYWKPILKSDDIGFRLVWRFNTHGISESNVDLITKDFKGIANGVIPQPKLSKEEIKDIVLKEIEMVDIEEGFYVMGTEKCRKADFPDSWIDTDAGDDETPHHFVKLTKFKISATPVTQKLWNLVMGIEAKENPSDNFGLDRPHTNVSWTDIMTKFIPKLKELTGLDFKLPSEAQWEYVAKGGHTTDICKNLTSIFNDESLTPQERQRKAYDYMKSVKPYPRYGASDNADDLDLRIHSTTIGVKKRKPMSFGKDAKGQDIFVYDLNGNVWEWCRDFYMTDYYCYCIEKENNGEYQTKGYITNPCCNEEGYAAHSFRGGSWRFDAKNCRNTSVNFWISSDTDDDLGFRLVLENTLLDRRFNYDRS